MDVPWDDLRYLEVLERRKGIAAAARELGVSASTVYRRLAALEEVAGGACVIRGAGDGELTELGVELSRVGRETRRGLLAVAGRTRAKDTEVSGELSLTTVEGLLPLLIEPIAELTMRHPLSIVLHLGDDGPSVRRREVDTAIGIMRKPPPECWGRRLCKFPYGVFGTKQAIARKPAPRWVVRANELRHAPESAWERAHVSDVATRASFSALVALVAGGVGLGLMPRLFGEARGNLVELPEYRESVAHLERTAWFLTHPDLRRHPRVVALLTALRKSFGQRVERTASRPEPSPR